MSDKKIKGKSKTAYFARYTANKVYAENRRKKLERALKKHPNNKQIELALKNISYRRDAPKAEVWSHSDIATAKLFKKFTGKFHRGVLVNPSDTKSSEKFSADSKTRNVNIFEHFKAPTFNQNSMFSLKERAHSNGVRVWI